MRRALIAMVGCTALFLSLGCRHICGVNDCGGDIPICGHCHGEGGCGCGGMKEEVVTKPEVIPPGKGKGSGSGSAPVVPKGSGSAKSLPQI